MIEPSVPDAARNTGTWQSAAASFSRSDQLNQALFPLQSEIPVHRPNDGHQAYAS